MHRQTSDARKHLRRNSSGFTPETVEQKVGSDVRLDQNRTLATFGGSASRRGPRYRSFCAWSEREFQMPC